MDIDLELIRSRVKILAYMTPEYRFQQKSGNSVIRMNQKEFLKSLDKIQTHKLEEVLLENENDKKIKEKFKKDKQEYNKSVKNEEKKPKTKLKSIFYEYKDNIIFLEPLKSSTSEEEKTKYLFDFETDLERKEYLHSLQNLHLQQQQQYSLDQKVFKIYIEKEELEKINLDIRYKQKKCIQEIKEFFNKKEEFLDSIDIIFEFKCNKNHDKSQDRKLSSKSYIKSINCLKTHCDFYESVFELFEIDSSSNDEKEKKQERLDKTTTTTTTKNSNSNSNININDYIILSIENTIEEIKQRRKEYKELERILRQDINLSHQKVLELKERIYQKKIQGIGIGMNKEEETKEFNENEEKESLIGKKWSELTDKQKRKVIFERIFTFLHKDYWSSLIKEKRKSYVKTHNMDKEKELELENKAKQLTEYMFSKELKEIKWKRKEGKCGFSNQTIKNAIEFFE